MAAWCGEDVPGVAPPGEIQADACQLGTYYDEHALQEWKRLGGDGFVEWEMLVRAFNDHLPTAGRILDLGGGPGRWSVWLAQRGLAVTLADLSPGALQIASRYAEYRGTSIERLIEADARNLRALQSSSFDAVLACGPFYHLVSLGDRQAASAEIRRVLRPGGLLLACVMPRYFRAAMAVLRHKREGLARAREMLTEGLGRQVGRGFPTAYLSRPEDVAPFFEASGFETIRLLSVHSFLLFALPEVWQLRSEDPGCFRELIDLAYSVADDPALFGFAGQLLYVGSKREPSTAGGR